MQIESGTNSFDTSLYALKKSMQVQEQLVEKIIDSALKVQNNTQNNSHLGKYLDIRG